ncbi:MAG: sulfotransferase [Wenzhouxiangella sp.]
MSAYLGVDRTRHWSEMPPPADDIEGTVSLYRLVMDIWQRSTELLRPRVHTVRYEELVADPETQARALLGLLELDWDERVLDTAAEARSRGRINTPSYHQVSRPIYTEVVDRWRRYRAHLEPWLPVLAPYAKRHDFRIDSEPV